MLWLGAEPCAEPASREADSSSLGSSKQPTTPQPPGGAAVETDGEAADAGPAAAAEAMAAEHDEAHGSGGSPAGGSVRSALRRKGSAKSALGKNGRGQQVREIAECYLLAWCVLRCV